MSTKSRILVIDDEKGIREVLQDILEDEGHSVTAVADGDMARAAFKAEHFDTIFMDIWMPDVDGISLLKEFQTLGTQTPIIMISGHGTVETAVEAIQFGAFDFLEKPLSTAKLLLTLNHALQSRAQNQELAILRQQVDPISELVGDSPKLAALREQIDRIGRTASWVMVYGPTGSGKAVVARALHNASTRRKFPFTEISLAAIPAQNIAHRLFGSEEEGSVQKGCFEQAEGGTLHLDEIGDLDSEMQTKLLSALQAGRFLRVGGRQPIEMDVRIISSTNQAIDKLVAQDVFRQDLYSRLNVMQVRVPALVEHIDDIEALVQFYIQQAVNREQLPYRHLSTSAVNKLRHYPWPGNVRELINLVQRLMVAGGKTTVSGEEVDALLHPETPPASVANGRLDSVLNAEYRSARDDFETTYFEHHLNNLNGNVSALAEITGIERTHLYRKLKALGINPKQWKK